MEPVTSLPLNRLHFGHEHPSGSVNSRNYGRDQIDGMGESIKTFGILQPLLVVLDKDNGYVAAGNLRLAALRELVGKKAIPKDHPVPITIRDMDIGQALAASLEENIRRAPIHPVEQYEAFAALRDRGWDIARIAQAYGMKQADVEKALALGRLSPKIREAWVKGRIRAESAQAFTMGSDHKRQDAAFERLRKQAEWKLNQPQEIRHALVGDTQSTGRLLAFIGHKAYVAAGGTIVTDLFGSNHGVSDWPMLEKLALQKVEDKCAELKAAGWSWAEPRGNDLQVLYRFECVTGNSNVAKASEKDKARSGCFVEVDHDGKLKVHYGLTPPADKKSGKKAAKGVETTARGFPVKQDLSNALRGRVDQWTAQATKGALIEDAYGDEVAITLAKVVAAQIIPERLGYIPREVREALPKIRDGLDPKIMGEALRRRFDAKDYFQNAPKAFVLTAIRESMGEDHAKKLNGKKKADVWKFAIEHVPSTGWLPKPMRWAGYALGKKAKRS